MHDLAIRNGRIIDGSGSPEFAGDIGIDGDTITTVGGDVGPARRDIDACGRLVVPGWIDIHTHFDAQVSWDPYLTPSCWNGVTTVVMGNCGVGFAPVRPQDRDWLMDLMDAVEDIPAIAMSAGMTWSWETFPEYLDAIDGQPRIMDALTQVPHCALRTYVMGERGAEDIQPTPAELAEMQRLVREAVQAGAFGTSSNRLLAHRTREGELIPGTLARYPELEAIANGMSEAGGGVFQFVGSLRARVAVLDRQDQRDHRDPALGRGPGGAPRRAAGTGRGGGAAHLSAGARPRHDDPAEPGRVVASLGAEPGLS